jgi:hypothetical protein
LLLVEVAVVGVYKRTSVMAVTAVLVAVGANVATALLASEILHLEAHHKEIMEVRCGWFFKAGGGGGVLVAVGVTHLSAAGGNGGAGASTIR